MDIAVCDSNTVKPDTTQESTVVQEPIVRVDLLTSLLSNSVSWADVKKHKLNDNELDYLFANDRLSRREFVEYVVTIDRKSKTKAYRLYDKAKFLDSTVKAVFNNTIAVTTVFRDFRVYGVFLTRIRPVTQGKIKAKEDRKIKREEIRKAKVNTREERKTEKLLEHVKKSVETILIKLPKYIEKMPADRLPVNDLMEMREHLILVVDSRMGLNLKSGNCQ